MITPNKRILVVANGEPPSARLLFDLVKEHDQLVAVDGGANLCAELGLIPDILIGDGDSFSQEKRELYPSMAFIERFDQNQSDLEKTLAYLLEKKGCSITVCGALGKRIDHSLFNLFILSRYPNQVKFETDYETCFALPPESQIPCQIGQTLSLIPLTHVTHITSRGLKWELNGKDLSPSLVSLSNICLQDTLCISFQEGNLLLSFPKI